MQRKLLVSALWLGAALVAGLAPGAQATHPTPPPRTDQVTIIAQTFSPDAVAVALGTNVTWTNEDETVHSITAFPGQSVTFDLDPVAPKSFSPTGKNRVGFRFDELGVFRYHCNYHANMTGEVRVVASFDEPARPVQTSSENRFTPEYVHVNWTQPVRWENPTAEAHRVLFEDPVMGAAVDLYPGANATSTVPGWGSFRYRCELHSLDFERGMVGKLHAGPHEAAFTPRIFIRAPEHGAAVSGVVHVLGVAESGYERVLVDTVEVSIGEDGPWLPANWVDLNETTVVWDYPWDTSALAEGTYMIRARALSEFHPDPFPTWTTVEVNHTAPTPEPAPAKSRVPGAAPVLVLGALAIAACAAGRRNL